VSKSAEQVLTAARLHLKSARFLTLATQGMRIWSECLPFRMEEEELLCVLPADSQSLANVRLNPRVSFSLGNPEKGWSVLGSGIARIDPGSVTTIRISPYRFAVSRSVTETSAIHLIEKRRLGWTAAQPESVGANRHEGSAARARFWLKAMRSVSFPLSILPVALGTAVGLMRGAFDPINFLLALLGGVSAHAAINLISDYNDFKKGVDTTDARSSHPGALVDELVLPEIVLIAAFLMFAITGGVGSLLLLRAGYPVLLFGLAGILGGCLYTSGSLAYKYRGLGELFIPLLMGPLMVVGACYVQTGTADPLAFLLSFALGALVGSVTLSNNLRDMVDDARARIRTLPAIIGVGPAKALYYGMIVLPYAIVGGTVALFHSYYPLLLVLLSLPAAVKAIRAMATAGASGEEILAKAAEHRYPLRSIRLHFLFGLFLVLGCLLTVFLPPLV
jgi:1,4-dihydroxy-2-naphthoate octaprenyltransferase